MNFSTIAFWIWGTACIAALVQGVLLGLHTWEHRRFARRRIHDQRPVDQTRRVALLAPCKGLDLQLESNLLHLLRQDYQNYEVVFIVESETDPALAIIQNLIQRESRVPASVIVAGRANATGQKIHNLATAATRLSDNVDILAFVDSDICPEPDWLGRLVSRLSRSDAGAITGYRWFVPVRLTLANCLLYSINASIAALLGSGGQSIVWGGSWAMRRSDFEALGIRERWQGTISDDLVATQAVQDARLPIEFEPACMTASPMDYSLRGLGSFLRRQHMIGRIYAPRIWYQSLGVMVVSTVAVFGACGLLVVGLSSGENWSRWPAGFLLTWYALQVYRGWLRRGLAQVYVQNWTSFTAWAALFDVFAAPVTLLYNTLVMCSACFGSRIVWRGITYDLDRQGRLMRVLQPAVMPPPADRQLRYDPADPRSRETDRAPLAHPTRTSSRDQTPRR